MSTDDGNIARIRDLVVYWDVLLDCEFENFVFARNCSFWIFANVLGL